MTTPDRRYPNVVQAISATPWAIIPEVLSAITEVISLRAAGGHLDAEEIEQRIAAGPGSRAPYQAAGAVAVIPVTGVLVPRANLMSAISGGTSAQQIGAAVDAAAADPDIAAIVLDVDSPGGSVSLIPETAAKVRAAAADKRVVACASGTCASAAYWIASQAGEFVASPSSIVGSIGVLSAHEDQSGLYEQMGVETTLVHAGRFKVEGNPFGPLADDARAEMQRMVDDFYGMFVADVARGRGVSTATARGPQFGEGRVLTAKRAVQAGMADRMDTLDATIARVMRSPRKSATRAGADDLHLSSKATPALETTFVREDEDTADDPSADLLAQIRDEIVGVTTSLKEAAR